MPDINMNELAAEMKEGLEGVEYGPWKVVDGNGVRNDKGFLALTHQPVRYEGQQERYDRDVFTHHATDNHIARCSPDNILALLTEREAHLSAFKQIAAQGGNLPDDRLESKSGPNDAVSRGIMYTTSREIARSILKSAKGE